MDCQFETNIAEDSELKLNTDVGAGRVFFSRLQSGIILTLIDCKLNQPLTLKCRSPFEVIGFSFNVFGTMSTQGNSFKETVRFKPGENSLNWCPKLSDSTETLEPGHLRRLGIAVTRDKLSCFAQETLPAVIRKRPDSLISLKGAITPLMRSVIDQIYSCPYRGTTRGFYIEGKVLELLAYQLEQLESPRAFSVRNHLSKRDIETVHHAAELLIKNIEAAPSLEKLALSVGMCRTKFHDVFSRVHGVTPFEYLRNYRLEVARDYLLSGRMSVTEAAFTVGYSSSGYFSKAFKKHFGFPPRVVQKTTAPFFER